MNDFTNSTASSGRSFIWYFRVFFMQGNGPEGRAVHDSYIRGLVHIGLHCPTETLQKLSIVSRLSRQRCVHVVKERFLKAIATNSDVEDMGVLPLICRHCRRNSRNTKLTIYRSKSSRYRYVCKQCFSRAKRSTATRQVRPDISNI